MTDFSMDFSGKTFLITGGGSGIGLATASTVLEAGGNVAIVGRDAGRLSSAANQLGAADRVLAVTADVSDPEAVTALMNVVSARFEALDGMFANAGVGVFRR